MRKLRLFFFAVVFGFLAIVGSSGSHSIVAPNDVLAQAAQKYEDEGKKIVPYVPTPQEVVERMLELAQVKKGDVVYDLGSGDGRIVVTAAKKPTDIRQVFTVSVPARPKNLPTMNCQRRTGCASTV